MLSVHDLYDLHGILIAIRSHPDDSVNRGIVSGILSVLANRFESSEVNQFRKALQQVESINVYDVYDFVFSENAYCYYPLGFLKDEGAYAVLLGAFNELLAAVDEGNCERIRDLADCLHDLPIILVENRYSIPKVFWKRFIKHYRNTWNADFLRAEQKALRTKRFAQFP